MLLFLFKSFYNFFGIEINELECKNEQFNNLNNNIYIFECQFFNLINLNKGSSIYIETNNLNLLIESCLFSNCKSFQGGAIYCICISNGGIVLNKICGFNCSTLNIESYQFSFTKVTSIEKIHTFNLISITKNINNGYHSLLLDSGNQLIESLNTSYNFINRVSGIYFLNPNSFIIDRITSFNNSDIDGSNVAFSSSNTNNGFIFTSNFINNYNLNYYLLYNHICITTFLNCFIKNNNAIKLIAVWTGSVTFRNCWLDRYDHTSTSPIFINTFTNFKNSFIITHFSSFKCLSNLKENYLIKSCIFKQQYLSKYLIFINFYLILF